MTDEQIIKSLKWLVVNFPKIENPEDDADKMCNCINLYCQNAIDLINRQKAEIERLKEKVNKNGLVCQITIDDEKLEDIKNSCLDQIEYNIKEIQSEAIKEFAERLKIYAREADDYWFEMETEVFCKEIDNLVKEMTENDFKE